MRIIYNLQVIIDLKGIILHNHQNEGIDPFDEGIRHSKPSGRNELCMRASYKNSVTGSLVIADSINLIGNLPIQGSQKDYHSNYATPGAHEESHIVDCSVKYRSSYACLQTNETSSTNK